MHVEAATRGKHTVNLLQPWPQEGEMSRDTAATGVRESQPSRIAPLAPLTGAERWINVDKIDQPVGQAAQKNEVVATNHPVRRYNLVCLFVREEFSSFSR
jgi:hypothetical protein